MSKILIVDDEKGYREVLSVVFGAEGYDVATAVHGRAAVAHIKKEQCDLIISDVRMPDMDGIEMLRRVREIDGEIGVVMMTAFGTIDTAREAFKLGADDFIQKPFNNDELKVIVRRTLERRRLAAENRALKEAQLRSGAIENIIGNSPKMVELFETVRKIASEPSTVLITGESGTGKELVARAIHASSDRADRPFLPINCGALPDTLLEAELFGFMKGAFTGAERNTQGMFESASGGTIFLDEIGEMSQAMQVKMLRVLQERRVRRIGSPSETEIDTRVIAATNRDLAPMVESGDFRQDLFYRVSVIPLHVPPLRERRDDISPLAEYFIRRFSMRSGKAVAIGKDAMRSLCERPWPGNVRELEHTIERAVALASDGEEMSPEHFAAAAADTSRPVLLDLPEDGVDLNNLLSGIERDMVDKALVRTGGNQTLAAKLLKLEVYQLRHLIKQRRKDKG
jgi:two-component system response regulator PilR (NtrC family)